MAGTRQRDLALEITQTLRGGGFEALWAGGCVRDQLLGLEPKDYDVATNARPEQVQDLFGKRRTLAIGASFGVIAVLKKGCHPVEVATFRSDGAYVDGRRPSTVEFTTAQQDAQRRDFTINGMFYDPIADQVIDFVGGRSDLNARIIRAIGDPRARFAEDKLRMLRAVRFAATLDFAIEAETLAAIREMSSQVEVVSAERIGAELSRLLTSPGRAAGVYALEQSGLLAALLPEIANDAKHDTERWRAILARLTRLESDNLSTALAAVLLDFTDDAQMADIGKRFRFSNKEIELAVWLERQLPQIAVANQTPWPQLQRILIHEGAKELLKLARTTLGDGHSGVVRAQECLSQPPEKLNPAPLLTGDDLVREGYEPGPHFAKVLTAVRDAQLEGHVVSQIQALELAKQLIRGEKHS